MNTEHNEVIEHQELENLSDIDFSVIPHHSQDELCAIKLNDGEFKNLVFAFKDINVNEEEWEKNDDPKISFDFDILTFPDGFENFEKEYKTNKEMNRRVQVVVSKILIDIITEQARQTIEEHDNRTIDEHA